MDIAMANGKIKGGNYERKISRELSLWISNNSRDDLFWRTQGSGSRHTQRFKKNLRTEGQAGDITYTCSGIHEEFFKLFCVEVKFYKDINLWGIITRSKKGILDFWKQARDKADQVSREPVLVVKENYKPTLFISNEFTKNFLKDNFNMDPILVVSLLNETIFVWSFDQILKLNSKKFIDEVVKENHKWQQK